MTTAVATTSRRDVLTSILIEVEKREPEMMALAPKGYDAQMFYAALKLYVANNGAILECRPLSVATAMLRVAQTGLELGVSCDILPFKGAAMFSPRYNGLIELAHSAGVRGINHGVVRDGDLFEYQLGSEAFLKHVPLRGNKGEITHAWACARIGVTGMQIEVMDREEVEALKTTYSKQWKTTPLDEIPWYARKTVIRRLCKYLPKNARFAAALRYDAAPLDEPEFEIEQGQQVEGEATGPVG